MVEGHAQLHKHPDRLGYEYRVSETARFLQNACCGQDLQRVHFIVYRICGMCPAAHEEALFDSVEGIDGIHLSGSSQALREIKRKLQLVKDSLFHYSHFAVPLFSRDRVGSAEAVTSFSEGKDRDYALLASLYKQVNEFAKQGVNEIKVYLGGATLKRPRFLDEIDDVIECAKLLLEQCVPPVIQNVSHLEADVMMATLKQDKVVLGRGHQVCREINFDDFMSRVGYTVENYALFEGQPLKTGPQARMLLLEQLGGDLSHSAASLVIDFKKNLQTECINPFDENYLRLVEILDSLEKVKLLQEKVTVEKKVSIDSSNISGYGYGYIEAPRGMLTYRTRIEKGTVYSVNIVTPTAYFIPYVNSIIRNARTKTEAAEVVISGNPCNACFEER